MSDRFYRISIEKLYKWILQCENEGHIFGFYKELFFTPHDDDVFRSKRYNKTLETPIGVAAGPHSQLAQNIIVSWLCGARYIELKTVQTLDEIEVVKPCIDMEDEGYNCEWSQELKVKDSFDEYINAWIIIHLLRHKFGWDHSEDPGFIFNMSVGYDYAGILNDNVQWFLDKMNNCSEEKEKKVEELTNLFPSINELTIPDEISNNITLSTMHGCPSDEIEKIGKYFIEERKLHTTIKLNPTLLGPKKLRDILNNNLGYDVHVPNEAFEHDLKYKDALELIKSLQESAKKSKVSFGLKLTNTLEVNNKTNWLPKKEKKVYLSGRALHAISINLASKLQKDFNGQLDISFSAGVDCFNVSDTLACNLTPITVCSDLLKPGGYTRLIQYVEEIENNFKEVHASNVYDYIFKRSKKCIYLNDSVLYNLQRYAKKVLTDEYYHKKSFPYENIKTNRELTPFDCVYAPCIETCAVEQDVPEYMYYTSQEEYDKAYEVILKTNPLPNITGMVCDHLCHSKCTRINYDNPLLIREIKRFVAENSAGSQNQIPTESNGLKVAIIGAGPSGLTCAYFLALEGFEVNLYESKSFAGGMTSDAIPHFRLTDEGIRNDIEIINSLGVNFIFDYEVNLENLNEIQENNDFVYLGVGAQRGKKLNIPGEESDGVLDQLEFLSAIRQGKEIILGNKVCIIGGGNSAVDAARTSNRIVGNDGEVTVIYRRTKNEMPADKEEIDALIEEGVNLIELTSPKMFNVNDRRVDSVICLKMKLGKKDKSGRPSPVIIQDSEFEIQADNVITAIGQEVSNNFISGKTIKVNSNTNETEYKNVFAGGDAVRGADSLINAMGDGKHVAENIIRSAVEQSLIKEKTSNQKLDLVEFQKKLSHREFGPAIPSLEVEDRIGFNLVHSTLEEEQAVQEANRCLYCNDICNICVTVCPNLSNLAFTVEPTELPVYQIIRNENDFKSEIISTLKIDQQNQILNIADFCNECGNCTTFCPTSGEPYKTKPRFYLSEKSFNREEFGYYLNDRTIKYKSDGNIESLSLLDNELIYETKNLTAKFKKEDFSIIDVNFKNKSVGKYNFKQAAEMYFLLMSLMDFHVFIK